MASTYSPSLKITLPGDGDQAGIWGQTTNTNLGTLIEQAITGVVSIVMSNANYTLSNFNGVSDEARNAVLVVSGSNSAVRDVIPPVVEKLYTVVNNTSGGFAIRVIGATGTGVNIASGATQVVYCDGVNFVAASGAFTNGAVLNVPSGGTGQSTLTANNVILGSGTSPVTFVSPSVSGNFLRSNGTTWESAAPPGAEFSSGTRMTFNQTAAPTGWTKDTSVDNAAFRLVSGSVSSGGTLDFSAVFAASSSAVPTGSVSISSVSGSAGATTLSTPQIPSHTHSVGGADIFGGECNGNYMNTGCPTGPVTNATGGGGSHTHPFSFSSGSATFSGNALNLAVKYVDLIIAQKN
jgi:hypothetical protein